MTATQKIYDIIRKSGPISRIDIHRKFDLRPATITRITELLINRNLICDCGKDFAAAGRTPELLKINDSAFHVIGLHAVSNAVRGGIVSSAGKIKTYSTFSCPDSADKKRFLESLREAAQKLLENAAENGIKISGIGLALPGEVDYNTGTLSKAAVILPGLADIPCKTYLENKFEMDVTVDHDTSMITQAEIFWGKANGCQNTGTLFIGRGIGGSFFINGRLLRGARNRSGELGHIPLRHAGPICKCGLKGCFEALASISVIEKKYGVNISFDEIVKRAAYGEKKAVAVLNEASGYIGEAIAIIFDILDIELLVVNGDIIAAEKLIREPVLDSFAAHVHSKQPLNKEFIVYSCFGQEVGVLGSAAAACHKAFAGFGIEI